MAVKILSLNTGEELDNWLINYFQLIRTLIQKKQVDNNVILAENAKKLVEILPKIPKSKLLIETDAPYLTPHPYRGIRNEPYYTVYVAQKMAELLNLSEDEIINLTTNNAKKLFKEFL